MRPPLNHMMLHEDTLADEFEAILGYRTSHEGIVLAGGVTEPTTETFSPAAGDDGRLLVTLADPTNLDFTTVGTPTWVSNGANVVVSVVSGNLLEYAFGLYFLKFTGLPPITTCTAATLHMYLNSAAVPAAIAIEAMLTPTPVDNPTGGQNVFLAPYTFTLDDEYPSESFVTGAMNVIDILPNVITGWINAGRGGDGALVLKVVGDGVLDLSTSWATKDNATAQRHPYITLTYT